MPTRELPIEAFGTRLLLVASEPRLFTRLAGLAPPGSSPCAADDAARFSLSAEEGLGYRITGTQGLNQVSADLELALGMLDSAIERHVASHARGHIFVHAGVAVHAGRAIIVPGPSLSGKSTLVRALVEAGADYYSDEWAVLDGEGLVHPFPRPLGVRGADLVSAKQPLEGLGWSAGEGPAPVAAIVRASYRPGGHWAPRLKSSAEGLLFLLENAVPARDRPEQTMLAARRAVAGARILEGERGEAAEAAEELLAAVEDRCVRGPLI